MEITLGPGIYVFLLFGSSVYCLFQEVLGRTVKGQQHRIGPWHAKWADFGLFVSGLVLSILAGDIAMHALFRLVPVSLDWKMFLMGLSGQMGLALFWVVIFGLYRGFFGKVNGSSLLRSAAWSGCFDFFVGLIPIWGTTFVWVFALTYFSKLFGVTLDLAPQMIIDFFANNQNPGMIILILAFAVIVAPVTEELTFRAGFYRFLKGRLGYRAAAVVSSVLFATMHANLLSFLPLVLIGLLLTRTYERTGNLLANICFHALFNLNTLLILLLIPDSLMNFTP
ncbi:MAG: hypothetical protein A2Y14_00240 [Verrucomicrobia bacterium GWF2_51_19]|nr:MAG: hypothetical protein A2Y14_00240 [Verrucomicrobia bacterium GWF2_51_19]